MDAKGRAAPRTVRGPGTGSPREEHGHWSLRPAGQGLPTSTDAANAERPPEPSINRHSDGLLPRLRSPPALAREVPLSCTFDIQSAARPTWSDRRNRRHSRNMPARRVATVAYVA